MRKAIHLLAIVLSVFLVTQTAHGVTIYHADILLEYRYYESYAPSHWTTPDRLRFFADTGVDSDSANMKIGFGEEVQPLDYWGVFDPSGIDPFHDYGTVFNLLLDTTDFSVWEDKTYTFWDDAIDDDILDINSEDYTQFHIPVGTYRKLALPKNISISTDGIISWDEVEYADYYKIRAQDVVNGAIKSGLIFDSGRINSDGSGRVFHDFGTFMERIKNDDVVIYIVSREVANIDNIENGVLVTGVEHIINQSRIYFDPIDRTGCKGDFNGDADVDGSDLATFAADFGRTDCTGDCEGDLDGDNDVDGSDLATLAANFGRTDCLQ
nr:hypothetical protein [uncultured bacterium]